jgi:Mycobacterial cell wall arabinan synthesis protein/EmbC C-terminal domain
MIDATTHTGQPSTRVRVAQVLGLVALAAALVGALGPAERVRTTYSWPPDAGLSQPPDRLWYTPLLLVRHRPESIAANVPCSLPAPLQGAALPPTVLATARFPERSGGLQLLATSGTLTVKVGTNVLTRAPLENTPDADGCAYSLRLGSTEWSLEGGPAKLVRRGSIEAAPTVTGLFSGLDLRSGGPSIDLTTAVHATRATARQTVAWTVAVVAIALVLLLVSVGRQTRPLRGIPALLSAARRHADRADLAFLASLSGWWLIAPAFWDDGWIMARTRMFSSSGGFSHYYSTLGVNLPLDYWLEWAQHWLTEASNALLVLRLPALLCLAATWFLSRWVLARVLASSVGESRVSVWSLAVTLLVGAMAWGMTLRPEPFVAVLVIGVMACMVRFVERETVAPIATSVVLVCLAFSAHPAGIVALAPVLAVSPSVLRWARRESPAATAIAAAACALLAVLIFVGADLEQRRADASATRAFGSASGWREEITRYSLLTIEPYATQLRRASAALILLAVLAFVVRSRRERRGLLDLPAIALGISLVLLIATPSKWPFHFGTLMGLAAVAVASEAARLHDTGSRERTWRLWPVLAVGGATAAIAWCWLTRGSWNVADLRTLDWNPGFENQIPLAILLTLLPLLLLAATVAIDLRKGGRDRVRRSPWRVASWTAPLLAVPLIAFTAGIIVADTAKTSSWTLMRQNVAALAGNERCGLAEDMLVPRYGSARPLEPASTLPRSGTTPAWLPPEPAAGLPRFALGPGREGTVQAPWFALPSDGVIGLFVAGAPGATDRLELEWGRLRGRSVAPLGSSEVDDVLGPMSGSTPWRFLAARELPPPPRGATVVRTVLRTDVAPSAAVAVTAPVTYPTEAIARGMSRDDARSLVLPNLLTYFPCTQLPLLKAGIVEAPRYVLAQDNEFSPLRYQLTSPFVGILDLYELQRLPPAESTNPPENVLAFEVDQRIEGAKVAPPTRATIVS